MSENKHTPGSMTPTPAINTVGGERLAEMLAVLVRDLEHSARNETVVRRHHVDAARSIAELIDRRAADGAGVRVSVDALVKVMDDAVAAKNRPIYGEHKGDWSPLSHKDLAKAILSSIEPSKAEAGEVVEPWRPNVCPITGRQFFMWIDGEPTYGGPFDSYTIPVRDSEGEFSCRQYDHDEGGWKPWDVGLAVKLLDESDLVEPLGRAAPTSPQGNEPEGVTVTDEMVERAARANYPDLFRHGLTAPPDAGPATRSTMAGIVRITRAALEAALSGKGR